MNAKATETNAPIVVIVAFHNDLFGAMESGRKSKESMMQKLCKLLVGKYGERMPTVDQWDSDRAALKQLAKDKGLSDFSNYHLMTYSVAVQAQYDAIPVSMSVNSMRMRRERMADIGASATAAFNKVYSEQIAAGKPEYVAEARAHKAGVAQKGKKVKDAAGAPAGQVQAQPVPLEEQIEQVIARLGVFPVLDALTRILSSDKRTDLQARTLNGVAVQLVKILKPAEVAVAVQPATPEALQALATPAKTRKARKSA